MMDSYGHVVRGLLAHRCMRARRWLTAVVGGLVTPRARSPLLPVTSTSGVPRPASRSGSRWDWAMADDGAYKKTDDPEAALLPAAGAAGAGVGKRRVPVWVVLLCATLVVGTVVAVLVVLLTQRAAGDPGLRFANAAVASEEATCSTHGRDVRTPCPMRRARWADAA
jgi:hypothetical protein